MNAVVVFFYLLGVWMGWQLRSSWEKSKVSNDQSKDGQDGYNDKLPVFKPESSKKIKKKF